MVVLRTVTHDADLGHEVAINEFTTFIVGKAWAGLRPHGPPAQRPPAALATNEPPSSR